MMPQTNRHIPARGDNFVRAPDSMAANLLALAVEVGYCPGFARPYAKPELVTIICRRCSEEFVRPKQGAHLPRYCDRCKRY